MQIRIEGTEGLAHGHYGSFARIEGTTLVITVDPERAPHESAYPVTIGTFV